MTTLISESDVQSAESAARAADLALAAAEHKYTSQSAALSDSDAANYGRISAKATASAARAKRLAGQRAEQLAALAGRAQREEENAAALDAMAARIDSERRTLALAVADAERALAGAARAAIEYTALLSESAAELASYGLTASDVLDFSTCATPRREVRLRGQWHWPIAPASILERISSRVARAVFGQRHILWTGRAQGIEAMRLDSLLADVPELAAVADIAPTPWPHVEQISPVRWESEYRREGHLQQQREDAKKVTAPILGTRAKVRA